MRYAKKAERIKVCPNCKSTNIGFYITDAGTVDFCKDCGNNMMRFVPVTFGKAKAGTAIFPKVSAKKFGKKAR